MYIYKHSELEHYEIKYMDMQYEIIQSTHNYEYIYMNTCTYNVYKFMN